MSEHEDTPDIEESWKARTGLNDETLCGAIETLIFMSERPISVETIKSHIDNDIPLTLLQESIERLQAEYEQKHHGLRLQEVALGFQFRTKPSFSGFVQSFYKIKTLQLNETALEVLAMIAYRQPVSKIDIEEVRGVDSSHYIRGLMDKRLVRVIGRSEEMGRSSLYGTTSEFLEIFNLKSLEDLPAMHELEELAVASSLATTDIKEITEQSDGKDFHFDELDEIDELSADIKAIGADTNFTKELRLGAGSGSGKGSEDGERISAFDLLEQHIVQKDVAEQNLAASVCPLKRADFLAFSDADGFSLDDEILPNPAMTEALDKIQSSLNPEFE